MKVSQLRDVFRVAERQYRSDHKEDAADALSLFAANLLEGDKKGTVAALVTRIAQARKARVDQKSVSVTAKTSKRGRKGRSRSQSTTGRSHRSE